MKRKILMIFAGTLVFSGCHSVSNANLGDTGGESGLVFVRPSSFSILGTKSLSDYTEITYEDVGETETGRMTVAVGVRNRGGQHWYDTRGPQITLGAKIVFYSQPNRKGRPIYVSPRKTFALKRGDTTNLEFICPKPGAMSYQITLSDY